MTDKETYSLSRRKTLAGLATIGAAGAGAGLGTTALFSDTESFTNNSIQAGTTNLTATLGLVDIQSSNPDAVGVSLSNNPKTADGDAAVGLSVADMKPGDCIVLRATAEVEGNPMYVALNGQNLEESGGANPEPEQDAGGDTDNDADLAENLEVTFGYDSDRTSLHDNTLEGSITLDEGTSTLAGDEFLSAAGSGLLYRGQQGADPSSGPPGGHADGSADPTRIGGDASASNVDRTAVTHFIEICLPVDVGNEVQGDSLSVDLVWNAEQVRNNPAPGNSGAVDGNVN